MTISDDDAAFVLGGGGQMGAHEVGMLQALIERGIRPAMILGTSIGAINGAAVAADPSSEGIERLAALWSQMADRNEVFEGGVLSRLGTLARTRTSVYEHTGLRAMLEEALPDAATFADLQVPFQCVAASIESASERWFDEGPLVDAILASCSVPGLLPPVEIDGEHYVDGGVVNSIPVHRALDLGARRVFVLHVGRLDRPLEPPRWPWEVALVAFEIARRHRFVGDMERVRSAPGVDVHVLPTGQADPVRFTDLSQYRYRDTSRINERIARAREASLAYLDEHGLGA